MFQLLVAVIAIALMAALAIASVFYGGSAFSGGSAKAAVATLVNGGQQLAGAVALYRTDNTGNDPAAIGDLVTGNYLQALPTPPSGITTAWEMDTTNDYFHIELSTTAITTVAGAEVNLCERIQIEGTGGNSTTATIATGKQFGCVVIGTETHFAYRM